MKMLGLIIFSLSLLSFAVAQKAQKIAEFGDLSCADVTIRTYDFFEKIRNEKGSKGYIFIYNGKLVPASYKKSLIPTRNQVKAEIENIKSRINFFRFDKKRLVFIDGGFRENFTVEYWVVPSNATLPIPTPTLKKIKFRKGGANRHCEVF